MDKTLIVLTLLYLCIFNQCNSRKLQNSTFEVQVNDIAKIQDPYSDNYKKEILCTKKVKGIFYSANIDLINNTDTTICFWSMTCSWQPLFIFNKANIDLYEPGCDRNFGILNTINPHQKFTYQAIIHSLDTLDTEKNNIYKLGFFFIKKEEGNPERYIIPPPPGGEVAIRDTNKIIWSDSFKLGK